MLKTLRFSFVFIFLAGMLFTIFNYLPILEEETPAHRVELAKKSNSGNGLGDENPTDSDSDDSNETDMNLTDLFAFSFQATNELHIYSNKLLQLPKTYPTINTPPKI